MTEELVDPVPEDFNIGIPLSPCRAVEEAPVDLDEPETRPLPALPPAALLNGLSSLWRYPWEGLDAMESVLDELSTNESLKGYAGKLDALKNDLAAYNDPDETIVGADAVQLEYTRMFIGSFRMYAPPYASYYMDGEGQMYGPTAVAVEDLYAQFGLEIKLDEHDMPDHLRFLLAFMSVLALAYETRGNEGFAYAYLDFKEEFLDPWTGEFKKNLDTYAAYPFYKDLIAFTLEAI